MYYRLLIMSFCAIKALFTEQPINEIWEKYLLIPPKREYSLNSHSFPIGDIITKEQRKELELLLNKKEELMRVMTFNILFNCFDDTLPLEYRWQKRLPRIVETIHRINPDIVGLQETQIDQAEDIIHRLGENYIYLSALEPLKKVDPTNRFTDGILYRRDRFELIDESFTYHSSTPDKPSISQEAGFPSVNHHVILKDKQTGKQFGLTNCHLYYFSPEVRSLAIQALRLFMEKNPTLPMLFIGDLNLYSPLLDYNLKFLDGYHIIRRLRKFGLIDSLEESRLGHFGPLSTYTSSFEKPEQAFTGSGVPGFLLDRIFVTKQFLTLLHGVYAEKIEGYYPSDHFPVMADLLLTDHSTDEEFSED